MTMQFANLADVIREAIKETEVAFFIMDYNGPQKSDNMISSALHPTKRSKNEQC